MKTLDTFDLKILEALDTLKKNGEIKEVPCDDGESAWFLQKEGNEMERAKSLYMDRISISKQECKEIQERAETFARLTGRVEAFADFDGHAMIDIKTCAAILGFEVVDNASE